MCRSLGASHTRAHTHTRARPPTHTDRHTHTERDTHACNRCPIISLVLGRAAQQLVFDGPGLGGRLDPPFDRPAAETVGALPNALALEPLLGQRGRCCALAQHLRVGVAVLGHLGCGHRGGLDCLAPLLHRTCTLAKHTHRHTHTHTHIVTEKWWGGRGEGHENITTRLYVSSALPWPRSILSA